MISDATPGDQPPDVVILLAARLMSPGPIPAGYVGPEHGDHARLVRESDKLHDSGTWTPARVLARARDLGVEPAATDLLRVAAWHDPGSLATFADLIVKSCDVEDAAILAAETIARVDRLHPDEPGFAAAMRCVHDATAGAIRAIEGDRPSTLADAWSNPRGDEPATMPTPAAWGRCFRFGAIERGRLIGVGGTSGTGKTALVADMVVGALERDEHAREVVLWGNFDMTHSDLALRLQQRVAGKTAVELHRDGIGRPAWLDRVELHRDKSVRSLSLAIERLRPTIVVVDMAQQVRPTRERASSVEAVDAALDRLCDSIRDVGATAFLVAQASKAAASGEADLATAFRGTTTFVHSLDVGVVGRVVAPMRDRIDGVAANGTEWCVLKNRIGEAGTVVRLNFDPFRLRFDEWID